MGVVSDEPRDTDPLGEFFNVKPFVLPLGIEIIGRERGALEPAPGGIPPYMKPSPGIERNPYSDTIDELLGNGSPAEPELDSWAPLNLGELQERPQIRPTLGEVGLAYPGKRHVFSGPQESAKTLAAYAIALEVIRAGQRVVVIDFEMGRWDARDRFKELGADDAELGQLFYVEPEEKATHARIAVLVALEPGLVIIDAAAGAYDLQELDDNKRQDVERFTSIYVRDFWRAEIATIVLDHVIKNKEGRGSYAIGSERKVGGADVHLGFEAIVPVKRGSSGIYKITTHKDRGGWLERGRLADLHLKSDPDTHRISWSLEQAEHVPDGEAWRPTHLMEAVSVYLEACPEPVSRKTIEENVTGKRDYIRKAIDALISDDSATETVGARGARLVSSSGSYRAPQAAVDEDEIERLLAKHADDLGPS